MKDATVGSARGDAERVIRELLDAIESLRKRRQLSSASERPEPIPAFESAESSGLPGFDAQSTDDGVIQGFCRAHGVVERLRVTPQELQALSDASLLGSLTCKEDVLFMLRQIRGATTNAGLAGESEANDRLLEDEPEKIPRFDSARANLSSQLASQPQQRLRHEYRATNLHWNTTGAKAAILISIVSLFLSVLTLGVLYQTVGVLRSHATIAATPVATPAIMMSQQRETTEEALSALQAQATAAKLASLAAKSQADSAKLQADAAALSAHTARDIVSLAEAADVDVEAIYCSPRGAFSLDTVLTLRYRNSGRTRANNFQSSFFVGIPAQPIKERTVSAGAVSAASISADASIPGGATATVGDVLSKNSDSIPPAQTFQKIVAGQLKFGIWGYVRYTDVLGEKHQKHFDYVWDSNFPNACLFTEVRTSSQ